jgi:hypothetical protein
MSFCTRDDDLEKTLREIFSFSIWHCLTLKTHHNTAQLSWIPSITECFTYTTDYFVIYTKYSHPSLQTNSLLFFRFYILPPQQLCIAQILTVMTANSKLQSLHLYNPHKHPSHPDILQFCSEYFFSSFSSLPFRPTFPISFTFQSNPINYYISLPVHFIS